MLFFINGVGLDELFPLTLHNRMKQMAQSFSFLRYFSLHAPKHLFAVTDKAFNTKLSLLTG